MSFDKAYTESIADAIALTRCAKRQSAGDAHELLCGMSELDRMGLTLALASLLGQTTDALDRLTGRDFLGVLGEKNGVGS